MKKIFRVVVILFLGLLFFSDTASAKLNLFPRPRYFPKVSFYGDSGNKYKLEDFKKDLLIAVFWSRHCKPCISDLRPLSKFVKETQDEGIRVILISPEEEWNTVSEKSRFIKRFGGDGLVSYVDRGKRFANGVGIMVTPTALLVDANGMGIGKITGAVNWDNPDVIKYLRKLKDKSLSNKLEQRKPAYKKY